MWADGESVPYGGAEAWKPGDVIGLYLDVDNAITECFSNGKSLGKISPFERDHFGIQAISGYFPALSFTSFQQATVNFGATPFRYCSQNMEHLSTGLFRTLTQELTWIRALVFTLDTHQHFHGETSMTMAPSHRKLERRSYDQEMTVFMAVSKWIPTRGCDCHLILRIVARSIIACSAPSAVIIRQP